MKVGFLSIEKQSVNQRDARIALFDSGNSAELFLTVAAGPDIAANVDWAIEQLKAVCDAIVIEGNTAVFYKSRQDKLPKRPENFELDGKMYAVAPVVDYAYINEKLIPFLNTKSKTRYAVIVFKTYGKTVDELKTILKNYTKKGSKIQLGFFPDFLECEVHARASSNMMKTTLNTISLELNELLYNYTYAYDRISIAECVAQMLKKDGVKLKIAESFTGGALSSAFTQIVGASEYLAEGLVTYSVASKTKRLGVSLQTIAEKGVVSSDTAFDMAKGLMADGDCDIVIATTGNAGPSAQSGAVGLCYIAIGDTRVNEVHVYQYTFTGNRKENIDSGVKNALFLLFEHLLNMEAVIEKTESGATAGGAQ